MPKCVRCEKKAELFRLYCAEHCVRTCIRKDCTNPQLEGRPICEHHSKSICVRGDCTNYALEGKPICERHRNPI